MRTIGEVAELAGVSVRTLRHDDELGLLMPSERSEAGYRLYSHADLERLQEILVWRQLGFALPEIQRMLDSPGYDRLAAIRRQRALAQRERARLTAVIRARDAALAAHQTGTTPKEASMFEGFDHEQVEAEARERCGQMYVADERFKSNEEPVAPGIAAYVSDAIAANADAERG